MSAHRSSSIASISPRPIDGLMSSAIGEGAVQSSARTQTADRAGSGGRFAVLLAALLGLAALLVGWVTPPYQSPDSFDHLRRAAAIASGQWVLTTPAGSSSGAVIDTGLQAHMALFDGLAHRPQAKISPQTYEDAGRILFSGQATFVVTPGTAPYAPPIYGVHAVGWALGQALGLTVDNAYRLVSVLVLVACVGILAVAFRIWLPTPLTFALMSLPMTIFQLGSPTIDGICTSLLLLWLAIYLRGLEPSVVDGNHHSSVLEDTLLVILAATLISARLQMWPLLMLLMHRAWLRRSPILFVATLACALAIGAWMSWALKHSVDGRVARDYNTGQIVRLYLSNPGELVAVLGRTLVERTPGYVRSFVGTLGWMDTTFRPTIYAVLLAWLATIALLQRRSRSSKAVTQLPLGLRQARVLLAIGAALSVATVLASLLVAWTPYPTRTIMGVQGRYMLPAALMLVAIGTPVMPGRSPRLVNGRQPWTAAIAFLAIVLPLSVMLVIERYSPSVPWPAKIIMSPGNEFPQLPAVQGAAAAPSR